LARHAELVSASASIMEKMIGQAGRSRNEFGMTLPSGSGVPLPEKVFTQHQKPFSVS